MTIVLYKLYERQRFKSGPIETRKYIPWTCRGKPLQLGRLILEDANTRQSIPYQDPPARVDASFTLRRSFQVLQSIEAWFSFLVL